MAYHFKNLIFEGGGIKGIAYIGVLERLQEKGILESIERVGGTSAGAIMAILVGLNYSIDEAKKVIWDLNFNNLMDDSWGFGCDIIRLITSFGWHKGKFFRKWIGNTIETKTGNSESTFADIHSQKAEKSLKDIYLIGTNLSTQFSKVFSYEHTPAMRVADAARISMSIPLFFAAKQRCGDIYVDGGVLKNYPIKLFDREKYVKENSIERKYYKEHNEELEKSGKKISRYIYNKETLGFRLDSVEEIAVFRDHAEPKHKRIGNFISFAKALMATMLESQQNTHLHDDDWQRTIYVDTLRVKTTEFDLSDEKKDKLIESGRKGIRDYFDWYDNNESINK